MLTEKQLTAVCGDYLSLSKYVSPLNDTLAKYEINTNIRIAAFLAQVIVESAVFTEIVENLNYSAEGLVKQFPSHFNLETAQKYEHQPPRIASHVYANRFGNGSEASGDGWTYRGRGLIQLTFKNNYLALASDLNKTLSDTVSYLETEEGACESAGWFWKKNDINTIADHNDVKAVTLKVNGGYNGILLRTSYYNKALKVL